MCLSDQSSNVMTPSATSNDAVKDDKDDDNHHGRNHRTIVNKKWVLARRPNGMYSATDDAQLITEELLMISQKENGTSSHCCCADDEVIVESEMLSVDAFLRTMLDEKAYHGGIDIGSTLPAIGYGTVIYAGKSAQHKVGSKVIGMLRAQTHAIVKSSEVFPKWNIPFMPPTSALGLVGLTTGLTAYIGVFHVCSRPPRKGETVVVTGAAGAVGSIAAQLAKSTGARVIGVAGGKRKYDFLMKELQLDGALDYKKYTIDGKSTLDKQIDDLCPDGFDFIYDNVGGTTLDTLLGRIKPNGRVVICGAISQYSGNLNHGTVEGPSNYLKLAEVGAEMKGFNVMQYMSRTPLAILGMIWLYMIGKVSMMEHIESGIESFSVALEKLFTGGHVGKMLVQVTK